MKNNHVPQTFFKEQLSKLRFYKESYPLINPYNVDNYGKNVDNLWINSLPMWIKNQATCGYVDKSVYKSILYTILSHYKWINETYPHVYKHVNNFYNSQNSNDLCYEHLWITL